MTRPYRKIKGDGTPKTYPRAEATGRNLARKWVEEQREGALWGLLPSHLRERLGLVLLSPSVEEGERNVRASRERLDRDLLLLQCAKDRDAILAAVRNELNAFRRLIHGTSRKMARDARTTTVEDGTES